MTLKQLIKKLNSFDIEKYGNCQVYRPYGHWGNCEIDTVTIETGINDFGKEEDTIFIDFNCAE